MASTIKSVVSKILSSPALLDLVAATMTAVSRGKRDARADGAHVLVCPPGAGNIGDQAMVEAFLTSVSGPVVLICRSVNDFPTDHLQLADPVHVVALPRLVYGRLPEFARDFAAWLAITDSASSVSFVGADVMDGAYNENASIIRANLSRRTSERNVNSRILGFSWNATPTRGALKAVRRASEAGTKLLARDRVSLDRLQRASMKNSRLVADIVFLSSSRVQPKGLPSNFGEGEWAIVNASAHVARHLDQTESYSRAIAKLRDKQVNVLILPHVIRAGRDNDLDACAAVYENWSDDEGVHLIGRVITPAEVRWLASHASFVITGRMHLAVMALSQQTPAIVIATQGKVEGLMSYFDQLEYVVEPGADFYDRLDDVTSQMLERYADNRNTVARHLPEVLELAKGNVAGLVTQ